MENKGRAIFFDNTGDKTLAEHLTRLLDQYSYEYYELNQTNHLDQILKDDKITFLFISLKDSVPDELLMILTKTRNLAHFRRSYVFFRFNIFDPGVVRKALMCGAKEVYLSPIDFDHIKKDIKYYLRGKKRRAAKERPLEIHPPATAHVTSFGRIGKISKAEPGVIYAECNAIMKEKDAVRINNPLNAAWGDSEAIWSVEEKTKENLYFDYHYLYKLRKEGDVVEETFKEWTHQAQSDFSIPKTKVLWISNKKHHQLVEGCETTIYSLHVTSYENLSVSILEKTAPYIIILDSPDEEDYLLLWQRNEEIQVIRTYQADDHRTFIDAQNLPKFWKELSQKYSSELKQRVKERLDSHYFFNRNSIYSRFSLKFDVEILEISPRAIIIEHSQSFAIDTIIQVDFPTLGPGRPLFIKIIQIWEQEIENPETKEKTYKYKMLGKHQPFSSSSLRLNNYIGSLKVALSKEGHRLIPSGRLHKIIYKIEKHLSLKAFFFTLALIFFIIFYLFAYKPREVKRVEPAPLEKHIRSLRFQF